MFGIALITLLEFLGGIFYQVAVVSGQPSQAPMLLASWAFAFLKLALMVRVLSSWFPVSPYSKWIRWSYVLTDWMINPLRRVIPLARHDRHHADRRLVSDRPDSEIARNSVTAVRVTSAGGRVRFSVRVQPRASNNEIAGVHGDALKVRLTAAARRWRRE